MRFKKYNKLCILLAITVSLSAISYRNNSLGPKLTYALLQYTNSYISSVNDKITDFQACSTEIMRIQNSNAVKLLATRCINQKKTYKTFTNILYSHIISSQEGIFFISSNIRKTYIYYSDLFTTDYIHNSDGKKRN